MVINAARIVAAARVSLGSIGFPLSSLSCDHGLFRRFPAPWFRMTRKFAVSVVLSALLTQPVYAQQFPETERQKAEETREKAREARKKADREATDEAYKSLMQQTPNTNKKIDPWGGVRPAKGKQQ
jgi:hypothetical protein